MLDALARYVRRRRLERTSFLVESRFSGHIAILRDAASRHVGRDDLELFLQRSVHELETPALLQVFFLSPEWEDGGAHTFCRCSSGEWSGNAELCPDISMGELVFCDGRRSKSVRYEAHVENVAGDPVDIGMVIDLSGLK